MTDIGMVDPTAIELHLDPTHQRMIGRAVHGNMSFNVPYVSEIEPGFYQGGCQDGLVLPRDIKHLISLYPWEFYTVRHQLDSENDYNRVTLERDRNQALIDRYVARHGPLDPPTNDGGC